MINNLPKSLIDAAAKVITESRETRKFSSFVEWKNEARKLGVYFHNSETLVEGVSCCASGIENDILIGEFFNKNGYGYLSYPLRKTINPSLIEQFQSIYSGFSSNHSLTISDFLLRESLDTKYELHDMTDLALKHNPEIQKHNEEHGIKHYKVEYHPETNQVFTTFHRDGAWEIHHQKDDKVGENVRSSTPPLGFSAHVLNFVKDKLSKNEKIRINSTKELIHIFHKKANNMANRLGAEVTPIEKGIDPHQTGLDIHEFLIYPKSLKECLPPLQFVNPHDKMRFLYEHFGETPVVKEYREKLVKQGHNL